MKTLNEILNESLLDADFDVSVEAVYADNIVNKIIEIASSTVIKDYDKTVNELYDSLKEAARKRQEQDATSIIRKLREENKTCVYMGRGDKDTILFFLKFLKNHHPYLLHIRLVKQRDGAGRVYALGWFKVNLNAVITRTTKETMVFLEPEAWDKIIEASGKR